MFKGQTFIKRSSFLFVFILLIISLSACGSSESSSNVDDDFDSWVENIGKTSDDVFDNLNLEEGKDIKAHDHVPFFYFYENEEADFHGESFEKMLAFDPGNDKLYQFGYWKYFDNTKDGYELVKKLYDEFEKKDLTATGDLSESGRRIYNMPDDYTELEGSEDTYSDAWDFNKELTLQLEFTKDKSGASLVKVDYSLKPEAVPEDW